MSVARAQRESWKNGVLSMLGTRRGSFAAIQTLLSNLLIIGVNVATGIITARGLGPAGRGVQAAILMWPQFLGYMLTFGIPSALLYNMRRHPEHSRALASAAIWMGLFFGIVASIIGALFIPRWLAQYPPEVIRLAQWNMLPGVFAPLALIFLAVLQAREEYAAYNAMRYAAPLLMLAGLIFLLITHRMTALSAAMVGMVCGLPGFFWAGAYILRHYRPRVTDLGDSYRKLASYGFRSCGIDLLGTLSQQIDQVLVVQLLTPHYMGIYVVALSLSRMLNVFQTAVVNVLFPKATGRPLEEVVALTGRMARVSAVLTAAAGLITILLGPKLLSVLYGASYLGAVPVFRVLVAEVVVGSTVWVLGQAFMASGRPGMVTILQGIGVGLSVPLMIILIPRYGLLGAGLSILGSTLARMAFILINYPLTLHVRPPSLFLTRADIAWVRQSLKR